MAYTKNLRFDIAEQVGDRSAAIAANLRYPLSPSDVIRLVDHSQKISRNTSIGSSWRRCPIKKDQAVTSMSIMSLERAEISFISARMLAPIPGIFGDNIYTLSANIFEFSFDVPDDNVFLRKIIIPDIRVKQWAFSRGAMPKLYYRVYICPQDGSSTIEDMISANGADYSTYPFPDNTWTGNLPADVSLGDIVISSDTTSLTIPVDEYEFSPGTYVLYFVPLGISNVADVLIELAIPASSAHVNYVTNSVRVLVSDGYIHDPVATTGVQTKRVPGVVFEYSETATYYIDEDEDGEPLGIPRPLATLETFLAGEPLLATRAINPTSTPIPLPFKHTLRFDVYTGRGGNTNWVSMVSSAGDPIDKNSYLVEGSQSDKHEEIDAAMAATVYMAEHLGGASIVPLLSYTRIFNDTIQTNFTELADPELEAVFNRDYTINYDEDPERLYLSGTWNHNLGEGDTIWFKVPESSMFRPFLPIASPFEEWYPLISIGGFRGGEVETSVGVKDVTYAETLDSAWVSALDLSKSSVTAAAGGAPVVVRANHERAIVIDANTIQLQRRPVYFWNGEYPDYTIPELWDPPDTTGSITVQDNSHGIDIYINDNLMDNSNIAGWNKRAGVITLNDPLRPDDIVDATYLFAPSFVYIGCDLNPSTGHANTDRVGDAIRVVLRPVWDTYVADLPHPDDYQTTCIAWHWLSDNDTGVYDYDPAEATGTTGYVWWGTDPAPLYKGTLVLCDFHIGSIYPSPDSFVDARVVGGGLKADEFFDARATRGNVGMRGVTGVREATEKESHYYWDIGAMDGESFQADATIVVSVPSSVVDGIREFILTDAAAEVKITPADKAMTDAAISANGIKAFLDGIHATDRLAILQAYAAKAAEATSAAIEVVRSRATKHVAEGVMVILTDEQGDILTGGHILATSNVAATPSRGSSSPSGGKQSVAPGAGKLDRIDAASHERKI